MGKVNRRRTRNQQSIGPDHLILKLFDPGMTMIHRAGLGGLACTLRALERAYHKGELPDDKIPGEPWADDKPPWNIESDQVTLQFGDANAAGEYLRRLFTFGFDTRDDMMWLPGQYRRLPPNLAVRADLQLGLALTFLQHGKTRKLANDATTATHDPEGAGLPGVVIEYRACSWFKHQDGWKDCVNSKTGCLSQSLVSIEGPLNPGAVVRHNAFAGPTKIDETPARLLPLYFAIVGCLTIPTNRGVGVLLIPEVEDLRKFVAMRPNVTPRSATECFVPGAADAGLQLQVRQRASNLALTACHAITFRPTPWASQQKSRVESLYVPVLEDHALTIYNLAMARLPPRIAVRTVKTTTGKGKSKIVNEHQKSFRTDSIVRPLIAENLARGRRWYADFARLLTAINPTTGKPYRNQLSFEKKGLHQMVTDEQVWNDEGEALVVRAVHVAMRQRFGQIADDYKTNPVGMRNKFNGERERLRLAFCGAKTVSQARTALCDLFSRGGANKPLQEAWQKLLPMLRDERWQHTRDLALLALASYAGRGADEDAKSELEDSPTQE